MHTPAHSIRPCDAPPARRRADRVSTPHIRHPTSHIRHRPAFSLLELTIVLAIVVTVSAIAIPRYWSSIGRYRVDLAARRVAADLKLAQSKARATGTFRNVVFDPTLARYAIAEEQSLTDSRTGYIVELAADPYIVAFDAFDTTTHTRRVIFDGFGQPNQSMTMTLSSAGHKRIVSVDQLSGAINVTTP